MTSRIAEQRLGTISELVRDCPGPLSRRKHAPNKSFERRMPPTEVYFEKTCQAFEAPAGAL